MPDLPTDLAALAALVFALGARHGLDADHLATIDGLARFNAPQRFARWCGAIFALGHGAVVLAVATLVALASRSSPLPAWLESVGTWISITCLAALGLANLHALFTTPPGLPVAPAGLKSRWLGGLQRVRHPAGVAAIGMLFALSLDTLGLAVLFGTAGGPGLPAVLGLGTLFVLGMLLVDGLNGLWVSRLISRSDARSLRLSRWISGLIALGCLVLAAWGASGALAAA